MQLRTTQAPEENRTVTSPQQQIPAPVTTEANPPQMRQQPLAAETWTGVRPRLDLNLNNLPEEIVEIKVKWLALGVVGVLGVALLGNIAMNEGRAALAAGRARQQAQAPTHTVNLARDWMYPGALGVGQMRGNSWHGDSFFVEKPFDEVWQFYRLKCGFDQGAAFGQSPSRAPGLEGSMLDAGGGDGAKIGNVFATVYGKQVVVTLVQNGTGQPTVGRVMTNAP